jgi:nucleotide-binding universal stress UspA family protein
MYQRIFIPIDGSATSTAGLDEAIRLGKVTGARLRLLHAVDALSFATGFETGAVYAADVLPRMKQAGQQILEEGRARAADSGVMADTLLFENHAERLSDLVVEQARAWDAELIVIGTHGRRGMGRLFLGSDAEQIVRSAPVPVLLVRAPEGEAGLGPAQPASESRAAASRSVAA